MSMSIHSFGVCKLHIQLVANIFPSAVYSSAINVEVYLPILVLEEFLYYMEMLALTLEIFKFIDCRDHLNSFVYFNVATTFEGIPSPI